MIEFLHLTVKATFQTGNVRGELQKGEGLALQNDGITKLLSDSIIPKTGNKYWIPSLASLIKRLQNYDAKLNNQLD